ncbi:hypothetical protein Tco_0752358 [Tanacetum coccineum]|uniref:Uncharacterized protein n=1 Tax=Tanacetum coccineum TaxID=301880 RepID=A0ABQ4Z7I2_9ASTR
MKEQAYNQDKDQDQDSRTQRQSNLHKSKEARFKDLASREIVSLKILSQKWKLGHSVRNPLSLKYLRCNRLDGYRGPFRRHLEEIHVNWTQFEKNQDKIVTLHEDDQDLAYNTPLVSPFLDLDDKLDDGEVLNELDEYWNGGNFYPNRIINSMDGDDLAFQCPEHQIDEDMKEWLTRGHVSVDGVT